MTHSIKRVLLVLLSASGLAVADVTTRPATQPATPINLKTFGDFPFDNDRGTLNDVPLAFRQMDGQRVTFVGEMWQPVEREDGTLSSFQMIYSMTKWSFRGPPHPQDFWDCTPIRGVVVKAIEGHVQVTGVMHVAIKKQFDTVKTIYSIDVESATPFEGDFPKPSQPTSQAAPTTRR